MCTDCIELGLNDPDGIDDLIDSFSPKRRERKKNNIKQLPLYREIFELSKKWCALEIQFDAMPDIKERYEDGQPMARAISMHMKANDIMNDYFYVPIEWNDFSQERIDAILTILLNDNLELEEDLPGDWSIITGLKTADIKASVQEIKRLYSEIESIFSMYTPPSSDKKAS